MIDQADPQHAARNIEGRMQQAQRSACSFWLRSVAQSGELGLGAAQEPRMQLCAELAGIPEKRRH
jgi:hypothetical protein